uniref:CPG4 domain-containing protein n=1 Tax=Steinernema glaseri TaxID=37863 RepID=A0A1I7Z083_9BILA
MGRAVDLLLFTAAFLVFQSCETRFSPIVLEPIARYQSPCIITCLDTVIDPEMEIRPSRSVSYAYFLSHLEDICSVISYGKDCIEECDPQFQNPFAKKPMTIICTEEMIDAVKPYKACFEEKHDSTKQACVNSCGEIKVLRSKIETLNDLITRGSNASVVQNELYNVRNSECKMIKCMARCSLREISKQCGEDSGAFFKRYLTAVLDAGKEDLLSSRKPEEILNPRLAECSYALNTAEMFNQE